MRAYVGMRHGHYDETTGHRGDPVTVTVDGEPLDPRFDLHNHSPDGFEWQYGGSGPAQLALALCAHVLRDDRRALHVYQDFKWAVVSNKLPFGGWMLTDYEIREAIQVAEMENEMAQERRES